MYRTAIEKLLQWKESGYRKPMKTEYMDDMPPVKTEYTDDMPPVKTEYTDDMPPVKTENTDDMPPAKPAGALYRDYIKRGIDLAIAVPVLAPRIKSTQAGQ